MANKRSLFGLLAIIVILASSACSAATPATQSTEPAEAQSAVQPTESVAVTEAPAATTAPAEPAGPSKGGTVTIAMSQEADKITTNWSSIAVSKMAANLMTDTLFTYDDTTSLIAKLAADIPTLENSGISADGKTYTINLREGVKWQDGEPFTSKDVAFTFNVLSNPDSKALKVYKFASIETPDDYTVIVNFETTNATFLYDLTDMSILPEHTLKDVTDWANADYFQNPYPGTGAFKFVKWERGSYIEVEKNPDYYLGEPNLDKIILQVMPNPDAIMTAIQNNEVDMTFTIIGEYVPLYQNLLNVTVVETPSYSAFFAIFNLRNPILMDVRTRKALNFAVDREGIISTILGGRGNVKWSPLPQPSWAWIDVSTKYPYDVEQANSLLDEVGWKDANGDGIREAHGVEGVADGTDFAWTINNITGENERLQICQVLQAQWAEVGAKVDINTTDVANYVATNNEGKFAMSYGFLSLLPDPSSAAYWYKTENALNWHGVGDEYPDLENILVSAEQTVSEDERLEYYKQFQEIIADAATDLYIYDRNFYHVVANRVHNFKPSPTGITVWNTYEWWVDPQ